MTVTRSELRTFSKFIAVGISNTVISYLVFVFLIDAADFTGKAGVAQACSYLAGTIWSFVLNSYWTFSIARPGMDRLRRFLIVQLSLLLLSSTAIYFAVDFWGLPAVVTWIGVMVAVTLLNFALLRTYVYRS